MDTYFAEPIDFEAHNDEVRLLLAAVERREQERVPVVVAGSIRNLLSNPQVNGTGFTFRDFFTKAEAQLKCQLSYQHYTRHHLVCDREMGLPADSWQVSLDFQNSYCQAWFGCPFRYFGDTDVPDTGEILKEEPGRLHDWPDPDPFWGRGDFVKRAMEMLHP